MAQTLQITPELWKKVDKIEGWLSNREADMLWRLCEGTWCEIGSWKGRSTNVLADKAPGYAIDWFKGNIETAGADTLLAFKHNVRGLAIDVIPKRMEDAVILVTKPIQLLFLDGEHTYEATKLAFELYEPKVKRGGIIVLHDVWPWPDEAHNPYPGVTQFAEELLEDRRFTLIENVHRCMAVKKL